MIGPILKSKRLLLKPIKVSEAEQFLIWLKQEEITKYLEADFSNLNLKKEKEIIGKMRKDKAAYVWSIYTKKNELIGNTGLHKLDFRNNKVMWGIIIGDKNQWGKGYGQEVIKIRGLYRTVI